MCIRDSIKAAPLVYDEGWQIDFEGLRRAITPQTRAIVVVHPNNPTGHFTKAWEAEELARICRAHGLALIVDEVFLDYGMSAVSYTHLDVYKRQECSVRDCGTVALALRPIIDKARGRCIRWLRLENLSMEKRRTRGMGREACFPDVSPSESRRI